MTKISNLYTLTNYISANSSGNVVVAAPASGYALDVTGTGRFTGALSGTSIGLSSSVTASALYVTGMTAGNGAIYHTASRLTFANYNTSGTLHFEVNGGLGALTLNADKSATFEAGASFSGALSGTSATFTGTSASAVLTLANSSGGTKADFTITENTGIIINSYEGASARSINLQVGGASALTLATTGAATFSSSVTATGRVEVKGANQNTIFFNQNAGGVSTGFVVGRSFGSTDTQDFFVFDVAANVARMFLTSTGNLGIGTTSPGARLTIGVGTGEMEGLNLRDGSIATSTFVYSSVTGENRIGGIASYAFPTFYSGGSERMRITSGGSVGIGTTSPDEKLTIGSGNGISIRTVNSGVYGTLKFGTTNATYYDAWAGIDSDWENVGVNVSNLRFYTSFGNRYERMRITSGGDVRVGCTTEPGAGSATTGASLGNSGFIIAQRNASTVGFFGRGTNDGELFAFYQGTTQNGALGVASGGIWFGSGSSGSERMRITSGGNVGIGTSSPSELLDIRGASRDTTSGEFNQVIYSTTTQDLGRGGSIGLGGTTNGTGSITSFGGIKGQKENGDGGNTAGALTLWTRPNGGAITERMRITSGGEVLVGSTSSAWASAGRAVLEIGGSSSTNALLGLKMGTTTGGYVFHNGTDMYINQDKAYRLYCIAAYGGVYLTVGATSWTANSDERLKTINYSIDNAVEKLMSLRAVNFSWKSDSSNKENLGLIAQDVEKVFPQVIDKGALPNTPSNPITDTTEYLGVRYQELVPVLVKAIQEQQVQIEQLKNK